MTLRANEVIAPTTQGQCLVPSSYCPGLSNGALGMAADHGEFAFRSPHQPMQMCGLWRYACGKATRCKPPTVVEALGIGFDYKREEAFAQSG